MLMPSAPQCRGRFFGREAERLQVADTLESHRAVTIAGRSGVGKSRLAAEIAGAAVNRWSDGVAFVDLAGVSLAQDLAGAVATSLAILEGGRHRSAVDPIAAAIGDRRVLLVLDNVERLHEQCGALVVAIVRSCPWAGVLVTSRDSLGLPGEVVCTLGSLSFPDPGVVDPNEIVNYPAIALYLDRAGATPTFGHSGGLTPTAVDDALPDLELAPAVAEVCRRLDGVPLAIELAAARSDMLPPDQISDLLGRRSWDSGAGEAGLSEHDPVVATLGWSYDLLMSSQQALLRRMAVFPGGARASDLESVCAGAHLPADHVGRQLERLVSLSLVAQDPSAAGGPRFCLLEPVREFAAERLDATGESAEARRRQADWVTELAVEADSQMMGPERRHWLDRLEAESDNVLAALECLWVDGRRTSLLTLANALTQWWALRGSMSEGHGWLTAGLGLGGDVPAAVHARALWSVGWLLYRLDPSEAGEPVTASLAMARQCDDRRTGARALLLLADLADPRTPDRILAMLDESAEIARDDADLWCLAHALTLKAWIEAQRLGRTSDARRDGAEAVSVARESGDGLTLAYTLRALAELVSDDDPAGAEALCDEAIEAARAGRHPYEMAIVMLSQGKAARRRGDLANAADTLGRCLKAMGELGFPLPSHEVLFEVGCVSQESGDLAGAREHFERANALLARRGLKAPSILVALARIAAGQGRVEACSDLVTEALSRARAAGTDVDAARALLCHGDLARDRGDFDTATRHVTEALVLAGDSRDYGLVADCLDARAGVAVAGSDDALAARLLGASAEIRQAHSYRRVPPEVQRYDSDVATLTERMPKRDLVHAWEVGASLGLESALTLAVRPASVSEPARHGGAECLTDAEAAVASLVGEGLSNRQIAERLGQPVRVVRACIGEVLSKNLAGSRDRDRYSPWSIDAFERQFPDDDACLSYLWSARFSADGEHAFCPRCERESAFRHLQGTSSIRWWTCTQCGLHLHPTAGTIMQGSSTAVRLWFLATYLLVNTAYQISAKQLQRELGVTYKTAWRLSDLIRRQLVAADA